MVQTSTIPIVRNNIPQGSVIIAVLYPIDNDWEASLYPGTDLVEVVSELIILEPDLLVWLSFLLRYLKVMENILLQISTAYTVTQERLHYLQTTTEEEMQQLRLTQASIRAHGRYYGEGDPALASGWEG